MRSQLDQGFWRSWCEAIGLNPHLDQALYTSSWAYYGSGFRARPGTLLVTPTHVIHHSYSLGQTMYALFESSIRVSIPIADIARAAQIHLGPIWWLMLGYPSDAVRIVQKDGQTHDFMLHEHPKHFRKTTTELGVTWQKGKDPRRTIRRGPNAI